MTNTGPIGINGKVIGDLNMQEIPVSSLNAKINFKRFLQVRTST